MAHYSLWGALIKTKLLFRPCALGESTSPAKVDSMESGGAHHELDQFIRENPEITPDFLICPMDLKQVIILCLWGTSADRKLFSSNGHTDETDAALTDSHEDDNAEHGEDSRHDHPEESGKLAGSWSGPHHGDISIAEGGIWRTEGPVRHTEEPIV